MRFGLGLLFVFSFGSLVACSSSAPKVASTSAKATGDALSLDRRADGNYDVQCSDGTHEVDSVAQILADTICSGGGGGGPSCAKNCTRRYSDGSCETYGQDFCGRNPHCIETCETRYSDGSCQTYGADLCQDGNITCVRQCTRRYSDGSCETYGQDFCGIDAECLQHCSQRYSDGSCQVWDADICSAADR
jgi:hypothetical protein